MPQDPESLLETAKDRVEVDVLARNVLHYGCALIVCKTIVPGDGGEDSDDSDTFGFD